MKRNDGKPRSSDAQLIQLETAKLLPKLLRKTEEELKSLMDEEQKPVWEKMLIRSILESMSKGNYSTYSKMLSEVIKDANDDQEDDPFSK